MPVVVAVVVAVVVMAVVVVAVVVMAVMAMTAVMAAAVAAAGRRVTRGGEGRNRQRDRGGSGGEDGTLHRNFSWVAPERPSPWRVPVSALRCPEVM